MLCLMQLMQIKRVFVFTSQPFHGISCKLIIKNGWLSTNSLARTACSCIYTSLRTQMASIWSYLPSMQRTTPESAARHSMSTCANWKSTAIWFGDTNSFDFYTTARPADERTHPDKHQEGIDFEKNPPCESTVSCESAAQNQNPADENVNPSTAQNCSHGNIVIDNIYGTDNSTDKDDIYLGETCQGTFLPPRAERTVSIPVPERKPKHPSGFIF